MQYKIIIPIFLSCFSVCFNELFLLIKPVNNDLNNYVCVADGEDSNETIGWFDQNHFPIIFNSSTTELKILNINNAHWKQSNSFENNIINDSILDERWEDFVIIVTEKNKIDKFYINKQSSTKRTFSISIFTNNLAEIKFCDTICSNNVLYLGKCNTSLDNFCHDSNTINIEYSKWVHLKFSFYNKTLEIQKLTNNNNSSIINLSFENNFKYIQIKSEEKSFWKLHKFNFSYTNKKTDYNPVATFQSNEKEGVIVMFALICNGCELGVKLLANSREIYTLNVIKNNENIVKWKKVQLPFRNITEKDTLSLFIETETINDKIINPFWIIYNPIKIYKNEYENKRISNITVKNDKNITCKLINKNKKIQLSFENNENVNKFNCPYSKFGNKCNISLSTFKNSWNGYKLCYENNICTCLWGYWGEKCNYKCGDDEKYSKMWGINCKNNCGKCKNNETCNYINGICKNGCENGFTTNFCNRRLPILSFKTKLVKILDNSSVSVAFEDTSYIGESPKTFQCQYKTNGYNWINSTKGIFKENQTIFCIYNILNPMTIFEARVILITENNEVYDNEEVPKITIFKELNYKNKMQDNIFIIIVIVSIFVTILLIVFLTFCFIVKKNKHRNKNHKKSKTLKGIEEYQLMSTRPIPSKIIKLDHYCDYLQENFKNKCIELKNQHKMLPRGKQHCWNCGNDVINKEKNRYVNLYPYDHSRVVLKNYEYGDYINANYVDGYKHKKAYIATQGPKKETINDFWYMIKQENVKYIVMLTNIIEKGKKKCEQYWPDDNCSKKFGDFSIKNVKTQIFVYYTIRELEVQFGNETFNVKQLHFTNWPDHGVPIYRRTLLPFIRIINEISESFYPIVVHCSAGVGRTGTIILCDIALKMAKNENKLDFPKIYAKMRHQRINLVDNHEQYIFAHLMIYEYLFGKDYSITIDDELDTKIEDIIKNDKSKELLNYLENVNWQDINLLDIYENLSITDENKMKNRDPQILPGLKRLFIPQYPPGNEGSDYINAVTVNCFNENDKFIVTQQPMPNTLNDFWRMIDHHKIELIISLNNIRLNDTTCCQIWPAKDNIMKPNDFITIKTVDEITENNLFTFYELELENCATTNVQKRKLHIFSVNEWESKDLVPHSLTTLLRMLEQMLSFSGDRKNQIVVTCYDGATASGLFVALAFLIEKIKFEHVCDVALAIQTVRMSRPQFLQHKVQVEFLYKSALQFIKSFEIYANFNN